MCQSNSLLSTRLLGVQEQSCFAGLCIGKCITLRRFTYPNSPVFFRSCWRRETTQLLPDSNAYPVV